MATAPGEFNCTVQQMELNGSGSSSGSNFSYQWTTNNGNILNGANGLQPTINQIGTYELK
ncbi:MAG: hypothetical protein R2784_03965 [Saprospiraceae bacterium]